MWANAHFPLYLDRIDKAPYLSFGISRLIKVILQSLIEKSNNKNLINYTNAKTKKLGKKGGGGGEGKKPKGKKIPKIRNGTY